MKKHPTTMLLAALTFAAAPIQAALVSYDFNGNLSVGLPNPAGGPLVYPSNTGFIGTFSYDPATPATGGTGSTTNYALFDFNLIFDPSGAAESAFFSGGQIEITDDPGGDQFTIRGGLGAPPVMAPFGGVPLNFTEIALNYFDIGGTVFPNLDLPGANLTEADFPDGSSIVFSYDDGPNTAGEEGDLDNLRGSMIPEPSSTLILLGSLGFGILIRRRS